MSAQRLGRQLSYGGSGSSGGGPAATDRFSLLLLEDGEYFFKGHTAYYWPEEQRRVVGSLKVCSRSLFFVPRDLQQPIFRIPYQHTTAITALDEPSAQGEDQLEVAASQRVEMKAGGVDAPYVHHCRDFRSRFSLVYACAEDVLPLLEELCLLCHASAAAKTKEQRASTAQKLQEIIRGHEEAEAFNPGWLEDEESVVVEAAASAVSPLAAQPGRVVLTQRAVYFQPFNLQWSAPLQAYALGRVVALAPRVYQLEDLGLEVFFSARHSLYLAFRSARDRDAFRAALAAQPAVQLEKMRSREQWTRDWVHGRISNFDYLMHLNREAGRSFKDLSQYPVMPWVLADYTSPTLDLADPAVYRDLSRPIGALNPRRLADFQQRFAELKQMAAPAGRQAPGAPPPLDTPPFLYGCHYSSPGYVVFYLMRSNPELMLRLQNGRFDAPDRLFWSVADTWKSVLSLPSDVKELVPEFYSNDTSFLVNKHGTDFGCRAGGQRVGDVALPPWAADPADFLYKLQEALESPHVSARLHKWVDLVFGRKSRGAAAERAHNVFHYLTYDEVARGFLDAERDPGMRDALRLQMMEFGRTPRQLFTRKHPKRRVLGRGGALACFNCFVPPAAQLPRVSTSRLARSFDGRAIPPVSRAVFKLSCSPKADKRAALLAFLEQAAARGEPEALSLRQTSGAELFLLVKAARDAREGRPSAPGPAAELQGNLVRAAAALATCPQNRRYILEAGCLDAVAAALGAPDTQLAAAAVAALAQLAREDSPRLAALDRQPLTQLLGVLRQPPSSTSLLAALEAVTLLAEAYPAHRSYFARQDLLGLLLQQLHASRHSAVASEASSPKDQAHPPGQREAAPLPSQRTFSRASRRRSTVVGPRGAAEQAPDVHPALLQRQQLLALAALLLDEGQKEALLASDALPDLLGDCGSAWPEVRGGAYECLASLAAHDALRQRAPQLGLLPLLLRGAGDASLQVQQPAAACIASLCSDPAALLEQAGREPGVRPLVALAGSQDGEVQRHAAAALWHLAVHPDARRATVEAGGLEALLTLARLQRNVAARELALQALLRCSDDEATRQRLDSAAAALGLDQGQLSAMLSPASARSSTGSFLRKPRHRKLCSDVPSSFSGAVSRTSSFRSGLEHGSPAFAAGGAAADDPWRRGSGLDTPLAAAASAASASPAHPSPSPNGQASVLPAAQPNDDSSGAVEPSNGPPAGQQQQGQAARTRLRLPEGPPLPLPIITPVPVSADDSPTAKRRLGRELPLSGAAAEAAAASPKGAQGVQNKVLQLERLASHPVPLTPE